MQEAKALKEQVDVGQHKEAILNARLQPWLNEAYLITAIIEGKLASIQKTQQKIQLDSARLATEQLVEEMKQATTQCTIEVTIVQVKLRGLHDKISAPSE